MKRILIVVSFLVLFFKTIDAQVCVGTFGELEWHAWNDLFEGEFSDLSAMPNFPKSPEVVKPLFKLKSPTNYNNYFGSRVEGFISVPTNTSVQFNVTGDRQVKFYLSTNETVENKSLVASVPENVDEEAHGDYPEQTSTIINLVAGQFYYFEILHIDNWSGDRFSIWWKTDLVDPNVWNVITAGYIYGVDCKDPLCPEPKTPCDDGDPTTTDDIEDGFCNCFGTKTTSDICIGERGMITGYRYDNIPGGGLNDLYMAENFPGMPVYSENYDFFSKKSVNNQDQTGYAAQAYLTVPVSGNYKFNVTGDDNTILFLSSDANIENRQSHQMLVTSYTYMTQHDKFIYQSSSNIYLEKGMYYYIEINEKDSGGSEHFSAYWQTPYTEPGVWKRIPALYFYDYKCELACIPAGTLCDDGNPFTNNDRYDDNCNCTGTPCTGPDCDSALANYIPYEKCSLTDQLDDRPDNNWISCEISTNPNNARSSGHWIMYDLGKRHELHKSQIWNYNVPGSLQNGMTAVAVDYSLDGITWQEYGSYNWALATGDSGYGGFAGPNFNGLYAQYILITSLEVNAPCKGLGKVAFSAVVCPLAGTACDDQDDYTFGDIFNENCECAGSLIDENDCGESVVILGDSTLYTNKFSAIDEVSSISHIAANNKVSFVGGKSIILDPGFETYGQTLFLASIDPCDTPVFRSAIKSRADKLKEAAAKREVEKLNELTVTLIEKDEILVSYFIEKPGQASIYITDQMGEKIQTLVDFKFENQGLYSKRFRTKKLGKGSISVSFQSEEKVISKRITLIE